MPISDTQSNLKLDNHPDARPARANHLNIRELDGEAVVYDDAGAIIYRLNATAYFIWNQCDGTQNVRMISDRLAATYDVDTEIALADTSRMLADLDRVGLLQNARTGSDR